MAIRTERINNKNYVSLATHKRLLNKCEKLEKENRELKEKYDILFKTYNEDVEERIEENKNLKEDIVSKDKLICLYIDENKKLKAIQKENESQIATYYKERDEMRKELQVVKDIADMFEKEIRRLKGLQIFGQTVEEREKEDREKVVRGENE